MGTSLGLHPLWERGTDAQGSNLLSLVICGA